MTIFKKGVLFGLGVTLAYYAVKFFGMAIYMLVISLLGMGVMS